MLAGARCPNFSACCAQGPLENLNAHLADPTAVNAFNYAAKFTPSN